MNVLNKLTVVNLKKNKKRTIATIMGVALSASLMFGIGLYASSFRESLIEDEVDNYGDYHFVITDFSYDKMEKYKANPDIEKTLIDNYVDTTTVKHNSVEKNLKLMAFEDYTNYVTLRNGRLPVTNEEIIVPEHYMIIYEANIGDTITFNDINTYKIVGIYAHSKLLDDDNTEEYTFYTKYKYNPNIKSDFYVTFKSPNNAYFKLDRLSLDLDLEPDLDDSGQRIYENIIFHKNLLALYGQMQNYGVYAVLVLSLMLISTILSLICIFSIYNSFAISITERKKMFGTMASVGATKWQIFKSVFFEALIISLIAIPLGFIGSIGIVALTMSIVNKILLEFTNLQFSLTFYPLFILIPLLFIIIMIFLSALFPAKRASEVTPIEAIRMNRDIKTKHSHSKINRLFLKIWGIEGELARKNIKRNKRKYRITLLSLIISIVLFITFANYINILFGDIKYVNQDYQYDIKITLYSNSKQEEILNKIKKFVPNLKLITTKTQNIPIKEIEDKNFTSEYLEILSDDPKFPIISVVLLDDNSYHEYLKTLKLTKETPIFINKISPLQMDGSLKSVKIFNDSADIDFIFGEEGYYKSLDTVFLADKTPDIPASLEACLFVNKELYNELGGGNPRGFPSDGDLEIYTTTDEYKLFDQKMHSLMMEYDNGSIYYENLLLMLHQLKMNVLAIQFAVYSFIGFITLIGVTSVFNTINTSINLRRIEFAILRSVGLSPKGFNKMIRLESVILGIKALLYGITISLGIIYITSEIFKLEDYLRDIKVPFPKTEIIIAVIGVFAVIFITMFYATKKLKDQNIIDEIRQENI